MRVELGHSKPHQVVAGGRVPLPHNDPVVTYLNISNDYSVTDDGRSGSELFSHLARNPDVSQLPDHEAFVAILDVTTGAMTHHGSAGHVEWVWSDNEILQRQLAEALACRMGRPDDLETRFHTHFGPPGVGSAGVEPADPGPDPDPGVEELGRKIMEEGL